MYYFADAHHALSWATEVKRQREQGQTTSKFYRDYVPDEVPAVEEDYESYLMPTDGENRECLAHDVYTCLYQLLPECQEILKLHFWGDFVSQRRLNKTRMMQEKLLRKGIKTRLNYRYSVHQLATQYGEPEGRIKRRLDLALKLMHEELVYRGLVHNTKAVGWIDADDKKYPPPQR